jgi:hypothetical protein
MSVNKKLHNERNMKSILNIRLRGKVTSATSYSLMCKVIHGDSLIWLPCGLEKLSLSTTPPSSISTFNFNLLTIFRLTHLSTFVLSSSLLAEFYYPSHVTEILFLLGQCQCMEQLVSQLKTEYNKLSMNQIHVFLTYFHNEG